MAVLKTKEELKKEYESICTDYLYALMHLWEFDDGSNGWWVSDKVGGVFCLEDDTFINMDDMIFCVDNNVDYETYQNFMDYNIRCQEYGFNIMNLESFTKGAPRIPLETFEKLGSMKQLLADEIEKTKQEFE